MSPARVDLKTGDIRAHLIRMTVPMIWGIAAMVSFQLVDTYYVSLLGTGPLTAMTFTFPVTFLVFSIIMSFGIAMSSNVSRAIGEGREEDVMTLTTHGLIVVFIAGWVIAGTGYCFRDDIFKLMGADEAMRPLIHDYMTLWFMGVPFMATPFVGNSAIRAAGSAVAPAIIMVGVALLNAALAPLLVFGLWGLPRMELQGAAIATVLSNIVAMAAGLYILGARKKMLLPVKHLRLERFANSSKRILLIALPVAITTGISPFVNTLIIGSLSKFGTEAVAAYGIATRIEAFSFILLMALAVGMGPIIGQNFGARLFGRVHQTLRSAIGFSVLWSVAVAAILMLLAEKIALIFTQDAEIIYYTKMFFFIVPPSYMFSNLVNGWSSAFNAMGKPQMSLMMTLIKMIALMIPAVLAGAHLGGVMGVFAAIALVNIGTGLGFHLWSRHVCHAAETRLAPEPM